MNSFFNKGIKYITDSNYRFLINSGFGLFDSWDDTKYLKRKYKAVIGKELNLYNPQTFNEKLQWLKLHDRRPEYTMMVNKYKVREYIADKLGEEYLIPLLGVWDDPDEIDFDALPNQFVLKCNHNSGLGMCICKDKSKLDIKKVKEDLRKGLAQNHYFLNREWPYRDISRKIICEKYVEDECPPNSDITGLLDYKYYCFNGEPRFLYIGYADVRDGIKHDRMTYLDLDWHKTDFKRPDHEELPFNIAKPVNFDEMVIIARKLSENIPFVRVDLYCINNRIYFSEMTFFPGAGFSPFSPEEWEYTLGGWIHLPSKTSAIEGEGTGSNHYRD